MLDKSLRVYISLLFFLVFFNQYSFAQQSKSSHRKFLNNIGFEQNFNIYQWWYGLNYQKNVRQKGILIVKEDFKSSLLRIHTYEKKWKDDQQLLIDFSWRFSPKWVGKVLSSYLFFSDKLSGITNDIKTSFGSIGIQYNPVNIINISSLLGYKFDTRFDQLDHGIMYSLDLDTPFIDLNEYHNKIGFYIRGDDFIVRKNKDVNFEYQVNKKFYTDTTDSISVVWSKRRRDNYDRWETNGLFIESLDEELGRIDHTLNYKISEIIKLKLSSNITSKKTKVSKLNSVEQNEARSKKDFSSFNQISLEFKKNKLQEKIKLSYYTQSQKNDIPDSLKNSPFSYRFSYVSPDFRSSRLSLVNNLNFTFSKHDSLTTNFLISIFRYDTPEESNYDDRDELRINASLSEVHYFSPLLKLKLNVGVNLKHLIFIYGKKSADNNWMRIFRLNPELFYRPSKKFRLYQSYEVLANYVDYDFEQQLTTTDIRSYVFRKFTMQHILSCHLSTLTAFHMNYKLELEENGKLFWNEWTEMLITTRQNHYSKTYFDFQLFTGAKLSLGVVFYKRKERFHILETNTNNRSPSTNNYISFGPTLWIDYEHHSKLKFSFSGTRRTIDRVSQKRYFISNINVNMSWYL